jgi:hypothetical protein
MLPGLLGLLAIGAMIYLFARRAQRIHTIGDAGNYTTIDEKYNAERRQRQELVDGLLDKIARKGMSSLSEKEKQLLREHSSTLG